MNREDDKARRAKRHHRNLVAKHAREFNKSAVYRDRKKKPRDKHPANAVQEAFE